MAHRCRLNSMSWLRGYWRLLNRGPQINKSVAWVILAAIAFVLIVWMITRG
jgi:hypothetical protein